MTYDLLMENALHSAWESATSRLFISSVTANSPPQHGTTITVDTHKRYQQFDGMGFCEAFQRGTQIYGADGLSRANTERVLDLLLSNTTGAGMTILRNGIGSSLTNPYDLMKSIETVSPASPNATPNYGWQGTTKPGFGLDNGQLQLNKDAIARGVRTVYADAWSAPGFMKNNRNDSNGGYLCGVSGIECETGDWRQTYANYLIQYLKYYREEGVAIDYVGFLNEPDLNVTYASMLSSGQQAADFLKVFAPTLEASGLKTEIACCDGSGWEEQRSRLEGIQQAGAESTLGLVTAHGYSSPLSTPFSTSKRVWQTEWADLEGPQTYAWYYNGSTGEGLTWANHIQQAFAVSNVSAFLSWIGAGNTTSNSALILLDGDEVNVSKRLWAYAHWGRTVSPDAVRVDVRVESSANVTSTAFQNEDGSIAVQVINNSDRAQQITIAGWRTSRWSFGAVKSYLTNNDHDFDLVSQRKWSQGTNLESEIPALSMMTFTTGG
ncbi:glycoside hydrolase family 30 protein [Zasmidium cellare ATCC 36951]|uniref:Glycoside hydrolase family 30 protein n=1 Tax=Zasmidium cellare ATCC 36951 TaxID=1080233 RepID=A0A6A6CSQ6_ZASCE|nr:glycoside hydrolase family 30 protein [Zasmidium cellare ATCC 36951]KAF2168809.1 glycoside hydrolase family 30 protein [Zasmidium cellare ATCC 36951]